MLFKDTVGNAHALIIEDKTNTSEHGNQMLRYREKLLQKTSMDASLQAYGQFYFLDKIFNHRSKGTKIGNLYIDHESNTPVLVDTIYSGTNNGGTPWTQYCFWGDKYPRNYVDENENEYHYMFWRIDCKWRKYKSDGVDAWKPYFYLALRHYDAHAHSGAAYPDARKRFVYRKFCAIADKEYEKRPELFTKIGKRENYKESDLLFIPIEKIDHMKFAELSALLAELTDVFREQQDGLYCGMEEELKAQ